MTFKWLPTFYEKIKHSFEWNTSHIYAHTHTHKMCFTRTFKGAMHRYWYFAGHFLCENLCCRIWSQYHKSFPRYHEKSYNHNLVYFFFYIKHLHSNIKPTVARHIYIYWYDWEKNNYIQKRAVKSSNIHVSKMI